MLSVFFILTVSYLIGSFPTGYIIGKLKGIDIRKQGSGNIGFTNVYRILGPLPGIIVFIIDFLKGYLTVAIFCNYFGIILDYPVNSWIRTGVGCAAIAGHNWSVFLGFKGGKGVLTSAGVFFALSPLSASITLIFFIIVIFIWHIISLGSLISAILLPFLIWIFSEPLPVLLLSILACFSIILKHRDNIRRLIEGNEYYFVLFKKNNKKAKIS